ncbi:hypothetical protein TrVFT333_006174 [Trichoderma virens FT-333]|nr:hypothetical protein TrVFT333_006174 [Trichoderma virens FT-333]
MLSFKAIAVTLALINVSHAATCEGGAQSPALSTTVLFLVYQNGPATAIFIQNSSPGGNNQQVCWDALENIINQCSSLGQGQAFGYYDYNGVRYRMGGCSNAHVC